MNHGMTKYHLKHAKRDQQLPRLRDHLLQSVFKSLEQRSEVVGIYIGGSIAKGNADIYSDIDLRIVVIEEAYKKYIEQKQELMRGFGSVLFFEQMNAKAPYVVAHYDHFIKMDLFIYTFSRMNPSVWLQGIEVVYDPTGCLTALLEQSNTLQYQVTSKEVIAWQGKTFAYIHEVYRRVKREEYYYALTMINNLRSYIAAGWYMEAGLQPNDAWDWSKIEGQRSPLHLRQLELLAAWSCGRDAHQIMQTMEQMVPELRRLNGVLCDMANIDQEQETFDRIVSMVL